MLADEDARLRGAQQPKPPQWRPARHCARCNRHSRCSRLALMHSPLAKPLLVLSSTIALAACSNAPARLDAVDASDGPSPSGGYAQAIAVSNAPRLLYVSGQIPVDAGGRTPTDFDAQCRLVWANLLAQLRSAGMQETDLVKVTTYLSDRRYAAENSRIRREILGSHRPALTVIISDIYDPAWLLEIEAVAAQ